jgi:hypothetical protein
VGIIFHEAEPAGCLVEAIEAHHQSLDLAAPVRVKLGMINRYSNVLSHLAKSSWICSSVV